MLIRDFARAGRQWLLTWAEPLFTGIMLATMLTVVTVRNSHAQFPGAALLTFALLAWLPLLLRTRWPLTALAGALIVESLHLMLPFVDPPISPEFAIATYQPVPLATMAAVWTVASRRPRSIGWSTGVVSAVILLAVSLVARPFSLIATDVVMFDLVLMATAGGVWVTSRRDRATRLVRERREDARRQVISERLRIARDLHDVLAHHLTLVNAQANVADYLLHSDPNAASTALQNISQHTRRALDELRATVGLLRQDGEVTAFPDEAEALHPVPGLERLEDLVAGFQTAGPSILTISGQPRPLTAGADLAAYRIVQEALTNATKHAPGAKAEVTLQWSGSTLELLIENGPGPGPSGGQPVPGSGHGLIGMRERAHACSGRLSTSRRPDGGFVVHASLPVDDAHIEYA